MFGIAEAKEDTSADHKGISVSSYVIFSEDASKEDFEVDSLFYLRSLPIVFTVNSTQIDRDNEALQHFIHAAVPLLKSKDIRNVRIRIRSAASPDGPLANNQRLSRGRRDALLKVFKTYGISATDIQIDVVDEEYELLAFMMRQAGDKDAALVSRMVSQGIKNLGRLKSQLMDYDGGKLWNRIKAQYFPSLRASRFMIIVPENQASELLQLGIMPLPIAVPETDLRMMMPDELQLNTLANDQTMVPQTADRPAQTFNDSVRREWVSVKSNLLQDVAYMPQYGFCPLWNVQLEYYPLRGHWTFGASLDIPWWHNRSAEHKYFQARNWQLEARRYFFRESGEFRGLYAQAYINTTLYGIGFTATKGWQGEGWGGGIGAGYVWKLGRRREAVRLPDGHLWTDQRHWRLELGFQLGYFQTDYDPYIWGDPVDGTIDGLYYYDWKGLAWDFHKRQYRFSWLGPTRVGLTLTYDILYRKQGKKGERR